MTGDELLHPDRYQEIKAKVEEAGYGHELEWAADIPVVSSADEFFSEYAWVVINIGMKNSVAQKIWAKVKEALRSGQPVKIAFGHPGKARAIQWMYENRQEQFDRYLSAAHPLDPGSYLESLPWIGPITKWHLAKNLGFPCVKPDRHLVRIAGKYTPHDFCSAISCMTGDPLTLVDSVLWRAAAMGIL